MIIKMSDREIQTFSDIVKYFLMEYTLKNYQDEPNSK